MVVLPAPGAQLMAVTTAFSSDNTFLCACDHRNDCSISPRHFSVKSMNSSRCGEPASPNTASRDQTRHSYPYNSIRIHSQLQRLGALSQNTLTRCDCNVLLPSLDWRQLLLYSRGREGYAECHAIHATACQNSDCYQKKTHKRQRNCNLRDDCT